MLKPDLRTVNDIYDDFVKTHRPETVAIHFNDRTVTLGEVQATMEMFLKHLIALGVKPGTRVGYTMPNCPEIYPLLFAISRLGGCAVPLFHMIPDMGKADIYKRTQTQVVITTAQQFSAFKEASIRCQAGYTIATLDAHPDAAYHFAKPVDDSLDIQQYLTARIEPNMPLFIVSSSGTTGTPKLVMITQSNVTAEIYASMQLVYPMDLSPNGDYAAVMAFPVSTSGILTLLGMFFSGIRSIFSADISPVKYLQLVSAWKAEMMAAPPAYFEAILSLPMLDTFDRSSVKRVATGMDFLSPSLAQRLKAKFTNLTGIVNGYGLIETTNVFMICRALTEESLALPTTRMQIIENIGNAIRVCDPDGNPVPVGADGELYVKGQNVISGYLGNPEETQKSFVDGWFRTGDIVRNEGDNTLTLLGRQKYLIKRGGKSVSPIVVQNHIVKLPGIKNAAVVGVPHPLYGEMVWAFIVVNQGSDVQLKDVMKHCRAELANYMVPDQVTFIDDIPKNPGVGKVNFEKLKEMALQELAAMQGGNNGK